jgi:hypothetical protein
MWTGNRETRWGELAWLAASLRAVHLKKVEKPADLNPWGKKPHKPQPFNLGSIDVLADLMGAKRA